MIDLMYISKNFLSVFNTYFVMTVSCVLYIFSNKDKHYKEMIYLMFLTMLYNSILKEVFNYHFQKLVKQIVIVFQVDI